MSDKIGGATQAMDIAQKAMEKAGWMYYIVTGVRQEGGYWIVEFSTFGGIFLVRISASTGGVVEITRISQ